MTNPTITLSLLRRRRACEDGIHRGIVALGCTPADDEPVSLVALLDGGLSIRDLAWVAFQSRTARPIYRQWIIDVYEARREAALVVLPIFERARPGDDRPRRALDAYPADYAAIRVSLLAVGSGGGVLLEDACERMLDATDATDATDTAYAAYEAHEAHETYAAYAAYAAYEAHVAHAPYATYATDAIYATDATDATYAAYATYETHAARQVFLAAFLSWCRARLRARLVGGVGPVHDDPALAAVLAPLAAAVAAKLAT